MKKWFVIICMITLFSGCAIVMTDFAPLSSDSVTSKTETDFLLTTGDIDRPYKELGVIFVKGYHARYENIVEKLKSKAKDIEADAVIKIKFGNSFNRIYRPYCRGVAIAFE